MRSKDKTHVCPAVSALAPWHIQSAAPETAAWAALLGRAWSKSGRNHIPLPFTELRESTGRRMPAAWPLGGHVSHRKGAKDTRSFPDTTLVTLGERVDYWG